MKKASVLKTKNTFSKEIEFIAYLENMFAGLTPLHNK